MHLQITKVGQYQQHFQNNNNLNLTVSAKQMKGINKNDYHVFFMRGNDTRLLSATQQQEITEIVKLDPMSKSFFIFNQYEVNRKIDLWNQHLSWIRPHYAIKCNPYPELVKILQNKGAGLDCASRLEIQRAIALHFTVDDIIYSNAIKDQNDLAWAEQVGVKITTADSFEELEKIKQYAPKMRVLWRVSFQLDPVVNLEGSAFVQSFSNKFGDDIFTDEEIEKRMQDIAALGVNLIGTHFHCGCGHAGSTGHRKGILLCRRIIEIGRKYGHEMSIMDLGGGFSGSELEPQIIESLKITKDDPLGYRVVAEPGRHFAENSFYLMMRVIGKHHKKGILGYFLNDSMYLNLSGTKLDAVDLTPRDQIYSKVHAESMQVSAELDKEEATFFGMTCDSIDIIVEKLYMIKNSKLGDWICIDGMGAYSYSVSTNFNGMKNQKFIKWSGKFDQ